MRGKGRPFARADLTGRRFGRLVALEITGRRGRYIQWRCRCDCGREVTTRTAALTGGTTQSCGCLALEVRGRTNRTHGRGHSREYMAWLNMRQRCTNSNRTDWPHYGGRGITICPEWDSFERFYADMGAVSAGHSLDRIDVNGNYEPTNCRWATKTEQARNTRANRLLTFDGRTQTMRAWSEDIGVAYTTLASWLKRMSVAAALSGGMAS